MIIKKDKYKNNSELMITIGMYDGVHKGHQFFLSKFIYEAINRDLSPALITMYPHPRKILNNPEFKYLTAPDEKRRRLAKLGLENILQLKTTHELLNKSAEEFIDYLFDNNYNIRAVATGFNNRFGKVSDNEKPLERILSEKGVEYLKIPASEEIVSSSIIRDYLLSGKIQEANNLLGYYYKLFGHVIKGNQLGRKIGFPTANIELDFRDKLIPAKGVYAVKCYINNEVHNGMMNIGYRPTISDKENSLQLEVHLLKKDLNIYDKSMTIKFYSRIRDEKKFENFEQLKKQLIEDKKVTLNYFLRHSNNY